MTTSGASEGMSCWNSWIQTEPANSASRSIQPQSRIYLRRDKISCCHCHLIFAITQRSIAGSFESTIAGGNEHRVLSCTQTRCKDRRKHDDKISEALSGRYFFDRVRVGPNATKRELRNVEANHSGPLRVLRDERWEAFQQWHYRYK